MLMPGEEGIKLPPLFRMRHGDRVADFLQQLLVRDAHKRLRCHEALISPYLSTSLVLDREADGSIVALQHKKEALYECIQSMRLLTPNGRLPLTVRRDSLVEDVMQGLLTVPKDALLCKFSVRFEGEPGIDAGGLTAEMYSAFFSALVATDSLLFETGSSGGGGGGGGVGGGGGGGGGGSGGGGGGSGGGDGGTALYLPKRIGDELPKDVQQRLLAMLQAVGRLLVKAIFDGQPVPSPFAPSLYKYLLGVPPNLHDLAAYDPALCQQLRTVLEAEDAEDLGVDFGDVGGEDEEVTNTNRERYVRRAVAFYLEDRRRDELEALASGFRAIGIHAHLRLFSASELMGLVYGQQDATAEDVLAVTTFGVFPPGSQTKSFFCAALQRLGSVGALSKFLLFVTAQSALPPHSKKIRVVPMLLAGNAQTAASLAESFPVAHTCFHRLELPEYPSLEVMLRKLQFCVDNVEMAGFGIA
jgi:hypothetical protein